VVLPRGDAGANDVTIILRPFPGGKRWQHLQRRAPGGDDAAGGGGDLTVGENYTIILGSHRNSKLKIEKNGEEKASVRIIKHACSCLG
jgi:hypothetical protein